MSITALKSGGDDLDDGLELDPDLLAPSEAAESSASASRVELSEQADTASEQEEEAEEDQKLENQDDEGPADSSIAFPGERPASLTGTKRKAADIDEDEERRKVDSKRRKKEKERLRKAKRRQKEEGAPQHTHPTHLSPSQLSDILLRSIRESFPSASPMEIDDIRLSEEQFLLPPTYPVPAEGEDTLKSLTDRVRDLIGTKSTKKVPTARPKMIILSLSGMRCADVVRAVRDVRGQGEVAKLFAKHFKFSEQKDHLAKTSISIAVGTPARVGKLVADDALKITAHTVLLLDIGHRDSKRRTLLTLPEIRDELWKTVFSGRSRDILLKAGAKIGAC